MSGGGALTGRVVVVSVAEVAAARALADEGAAVVLVGRDGSVAGPLVEELRATGRRVGWLEGDPADPATRAALVEMVGELFWSSDGPEPA